VMLPAASGRQRLRRALRLAARCSRRAASMIWRAPRGRRWGRGPIALCSHLSITPPFVLSRLRAAAPA